MTRPDPEEAGEPPPDPPPQEEPGHGIADCFRDRATADLLPRVEIGIESRRNSPELILTEIAEGAACLWL